MSTRNYGNVWVTGNRTQGYRVMSEGAEKAVRLTDTQREAIRTGRMIAANRGAKLIVQNTRGQIRTVRAPKATF